ncbi:MAG: hypothetical protein P1U40_10315 [Coxiellaceae bacterium]|nr:hypothetical protein [Coxiellaceae bacterium]
MSRVNPQLTSFDDSYQIEKFSRQVMGGPDSNTGVESTAIVA